MCLLGTMRQAVITVTHPKNRRFGGKMQFRLVKNETVLCWLEWYCRGLAPGGKLFPFTRPQLRKCFRILCKDLGLESYGFVPASLRAGGATQLFLDGVHTDHIRFIGGWTSMATLEHYIQEAISIRMLLQLPQVTQQRLCALLSLFPAGLRPPYHPWAFFFSR